MITIKNLKGTQILSKAEQRNILGGGTCAFQGGNGYAGISGVSMAQAQAGAAATGGHWCCDSCGSATWLNDDHKQYLLTLE
ncbi:hypothetical protein [Ascidiimonas sp. W6]|uniref:hypothetical protein n=1 Tax=Ascidiimonas meishanensis TaxID=3128903 RepID=UPI0030EC9F18